MPSAQRRYLRHFAAALALGLIALVALNLLVDPYGAYRLVRAGGLEAAKPAGGTRVAKAEMLFHSRCEVLILGSSRAEAAIDPRHAAWGTDEVYNAALSGTHIEETAAVCRYALQLPTLRRVVLFADFCSFSENRQPFNADFEASRFNPDLDELEYHFANLFGGKAAEQSLKALRVALTGEQPDTRGDRGLVIRASRPRPRHRLAFDKTIEHYLTAPQLYTGFRYTERSLDSLRALARACREHGVALTVVVPPTHALQLEAIQQAGLWPTFELWKREVTAAVEEINRAVRAPPEAADIAFWDFSGYAGYVAEEVPDAAADEATMRWFWESSHFKKELGDLVICRLQGAAPPDGLDLRDFGVRLTGGNIERHLASLRADRQMYLATHRAELTRVEAIARAAGHSLDQPQALIALEPADGDSR